MTTRRRSKDWTINRRTNGAVVSRCPEGWVFIVFRGVQPAAMSIAYPNAALARAGARQTLRAMGW